MADTGHAYIGRRSTFREARDQPAILEQDEPLPPGYRAKLRCDGIRDFIYNSVLFGVCLGYALSRRADVENLCDVKAYPVTMWLIV